MGKKKRALGAPSVTCKKIETNMADDHVGKQDEPRFRGLPSELKKNRLFFVNNKNKLNFS